MTMNAEHSQNEANNRQGRIKRLFTQIRVWEALTFLAIALTAEIAYWQGSLTRQALESGQRAFVVLREAKFSPIIGPAVLPPAVPGTQTSTNPPVATQIGWQFIPVWENAGNTPAIELISRANLYSPNTLLLPGFTKADLVGDNINIGVLGPKATTNFGHFLENKDAMIGMKNAPSATLWGWATYKDILPGTPMHITRFCYVIQWINGDPSDIKSDLDVRYQVCPREGNCTDQECKAQGYTW